MDKIRQQRISDPGRGFRLRRSPSISILLVLPLCSRVGGRL